MFDLMLVVLFAIIFSPIAMALFAKALGNPKSLIVLIKEGFDLYSKYLRGVFYG